MTDSLPKHAALMFRDVLLADWNPDATAGLDPRNEPREPNGLSMNRGWYDTVSFDPHVALTTFEEGTSGGGETRYTGIDASGGGPTQQRAGSGLITVFAEGESEYGTDPETGEGMDAAEITEAIRVEVERVVLDAMKEGTLPEPWTYASSVKDREDVDTDPSPSVWWQQVTLYYGWHRG